MLRDFTEPDTHFASKEACPEGTAEAQGFNQV